MTILSELKRLYKKITGNDSTGTTTDEVISQLADNMPTIPAGVSVTAELSSGVKLATVTVGETETDIYTANVAATAELTEGVKLATVTVGETETDIYTYAPAVTAADVTDIVTSLKALYIAKGGTAEAAAEFTTVADCIDGITALISQ